ncbi:MAG TPA: hypothetical protein VMR90_15965 [Candidatus Cybelea sp.]|nr:hypothetical protein [Candidatus Cybelea sp.]
MPGDPVEQMLGEGAAPGLAFRALVFSAAIAIPAGMLAAYRRGQRPDRAVGGLSFTRLR